MTSGKFTLFMEKTMSIRTFFGNLGGGRDISKKAKANRSSRRLSLESLESREFLAVSAAEFAAIRAQYADLNLSENMADYDISDVGGTGTATGQVNYTFGQKGLRDAITRAGQPDSPKNDLIVVRTTASQKSIELGGTQLAISMSASTGGGGSVTIVSLGTNDLTIDAQGNSRIFNISSGTTVALAGLVLKNGYTSANGGGIYNNGGDVTVVECTITHNWAKTAGGGICNNAGIMTVINSHITGNYAFADQSGVTKESGGGIHNARGGEFVITNSVIAGNAVRGSNAIGGGICNDGKMTVTNCTVAGNTVSKSGGAGYDEIGAGIYDGADWLRDTFLPQNASGSLTINNSIVANNYINRKGGAMGKEDNINRAAGTIAGSNNLIGTKLNTTTGVTMTYTTANPRFQSTLSLVHYQTNTGLLYNDQWNFCLQSDSLAIDAGNNGLIAGVVSDPMNDLAGKRRISGARVDIGAYEFIVSNENNSILKAADLGTIETVMVTNQFELNDEDYYKFTINNTGEKGTFVKIKPTYGDLNRQLKLSVYNSNEGTVGGPVVVPVSQPNEAGELVVTLENAEPGTYYIWVTRASTLYNDYTLTIAPFDDPYENNDTWNKATPLSTATTPLMHERTFSDLRAFDDDWYKFDTNGTGDANSAIEIKYTASAGKLNLELYDSQDNRLCYSEKTISSTEGKAIERVSFNGQDKGTYYIKVSGINTEIYDLTINAPARSDPKEISAEPLISRPIDGRMSFVRTIDTNDKDVKGNAIGTKCFSFDIDSTCGPGSILTIQTLGAQNGTIVLLAPDPDDEGHLQHLQEQKILPLSAMISSIDVSTNITENATMTFSTTESLTVSTGLKLGTSGEVGILGAKVGYSMEYSVDTTAGVSYSQTYSTQYGIQYGERIIYNTEMPVAQFYLDGFSKGTYDIYFDSVGVMQETQDGYGAIISFNKTAAAPPTIPAFTATAESTNTILLSWDGDASATTYRLQFKEASATEYLTDYTDCEGCVSLFSPETGKVAATITGLKEGTEYSFRLTAINGTGESTPAVQSVATDKIELSTPTLGAILATGSDSISVEWDAVSNSSGYTVQYATNSTFTTDVGTVNTTTNSTTVSGLSANTTYYVRVMALGTGSYGDSDWSTSNSVTTNKIELSAPTLAIGTPTSHSVPLSWAAITGADGYRIEKSNDNGSSWSLVENIANGSTTSTTANGLTANTPYLFRIKATGTGSYSDSEWAI